MAINKFLDKLALVVSLVLDPRVEIPMLLSLAVFNAYTNGAPLVFLSLLMLVDVVLPLSFYFHLLVKGEISHWDITERQERVPLYIFTSIAHLAGVGIAWGFGQTGVTYVLLAFWLLAVVFAAVTLFWKVSVHAGVNAALATYLGLVWGRKYVWLGGLVVLVAWSRVRLKRHGVAQVLVGGLLGALGLLAGMRLVGL